jgi:hypothetical protein
MVRSRQNSPHFRFWSIATTVVLLRGVHAPSVPAPGPFTHAFRAREIELAGLRELTQSHNLVAQGDSQSVHAKPATREKSRVLWVTTVRS